MFKLKTTLVAIALVLTSTSAALAHPGKHSRSDIFFRFDAGSHGIYYLTEYELSSLRVLPYLVAIEVLLGDYGAYRHVDGYGHYRQLFWYDHGRLLNRIFLAPPSTYWYGGSRWLWSGNYWRTHYRWDHGRGWYKGRKKIRHYYKKRSHKKYRVDRHYRDRRYDDRHPDGRDYRRGRDEHPGQARDHRRNRDDHGDRGQRYGNRRDGDHNARSSRWHTPRSRVGDHGNRETRYQNRDRRGDDRRHDASGRPDGDHRGTVRSNRRVDPRPHQEQQRRQEHKQKEPSKKHKSKKHKQKDHDGKRDKGHKSSKRSHKKSDRQKH